MNIDARNEAQARLAEQKSARETASRPISRPSLATVLVVAALGLAALTAFSFLAPGVYYVFVSPNADQILNTAALVAAGTVAVLAWIRYRETGEDSALLQASAFLTLFAGGLVPLTLLLIGSPLYESYSREAPGQAPLYVWTLQRAMAAVLLVLSAPAGISHWRRPGPLAGWLILLAPAIAMVLASVVILAAESSLPLLIAPSLLARIMVSRIQLDPMLIGMPWAALQVLVALLYLFAAFQYNRLWHAGRHRSHVAFLAVALVVAAFTQIHYAVVPGAYAEILTTGDLLRLAFYLLVLAGVAAGTRSDLADLVAANRAVEQLREADARRIVAEERARFARDIHDGLVQELWLARLTGGRLAEVPRLPAAAKDIVSHLDAVLESALGEARQAVVTLQPHEDPTFAALLERYLSDYGDRYGIDIVLTLHGDTTVLPAEAEADVLRICREALNNVRKHADAGRVDVRLEAARDVVRLIVADNGKGFDQRKVGAGGYGLESMRQRTTHIGGRLDIDSAPGDGTSVTLEVPIRAA